MSCSSNIRMKQKDEDRIQWFSTYYNIIQLFYHYTNFYHFNILPSMVLATTAFFFFTFTLILRIRIGNTNHHLCSRCLCIYPKMNGQMNKLADASMISCCSISNSSNGCRLVSTIIYFVVLAMELLLWLNRCFYYWHY